MSRTLKRSFVSLALVLTLAIGGAGLSAPAMAAAPRAEPANPAQQPAALLAHYQQIKEALTNSIFGSPIQLNSDTGNDFARGEVFAVLNAPFNKVKQTLSQPAQWCDLAILHVNIKTCLYGKNQVRFFVGRKEYQPPDAAFELQYRFVTVADNDDYLSVKLTAPEGPLGTSDYLITLEATAIDAEHSFIRFEYRYRFGFMGKMAMQTYLATLGRNKVGFTVIRAGDNGVPVYIKGLQGVIERNVMRYIFAIQSILETKPATEAEQHTAQFESWFTHIEKHPRQLVEITHEEYMDNKRRELANQLELQQTVRP